MEERKIKTEIDLKLLGERATFEKDLSSSNSKRYAYKLSHNNSNYILKGFKIYIEHLEPGDEASADMFKKTLTSINEIYQEYFFTRVACLFNPHFAKPLLLDCAIELAADKDSRSFMFVEIMSEYGGVSLDKLSSTSNIGIEEVYNLMRQSANALVILQSMDIAHFDIKPANMVYDSKSDLLKVIDMGSAFGCSAKKRVIDSTISLICMQQYRSSG